MGCQYIAYKKPNDYRIIRNYAEAKILGGWKIIVGRRGKMEFKKEAALQEAKKY